MICIKKRKETNIFFWKSEPPGPGGSWSFYYVIYVIVRKRKPRSEPDIELQLFPLVNKVKFDVPITMLF